LSLDDHRAAFLDGLLARDSARARRAVEDALAAGVPVPDIYLEVLDPSLREIGHRWAMGALNVAEEHYATAVAQSILDGLSRQLPRAPKDGRLAVVSGTPEEQHALGTRVVSDFLEADGWEVLLLGPGAPARDLAALVEQEQPDLVAPVHRRRRPVLDGRDEPQRARVRGRPRAPGPA
jgi:methanogenic corrinoid protein MtbC1